MEFKNKAHVVTPQGKKVGRIDRVVVDTGSGEVTHLVVRKGLLFTEDKLVPVGDIEATSEDEVRLKKSGPKPEAYPDFEQQDYIPDGRYEDFRRQKAAEARRMIWYHTAINMPWWEGGPDPRPSKPLYIRKAQRNIPEGTVPLEEGAEVQDTRGHPLGKVVEVYAEPEEHRVTHLLVSEKGLSRETKLVPSAWIKHVFEESVRLTIDRETFAGLPSARP